MIRSLGKFQACALALALLAPTVMAADPPSSTADANTRYFDALERANRLPIPPAADRHALLDAAIAAARENQRSDSAEVSLSGYMQESGALLVRGQAREAVAVLAGRYPDDLSQGMQAEYLYSLGVARYAFDPDGGLELLNRAVAHAPTEEFRAHLAAMRDSRLGRRVPPSQLGRVPIP